MSWPIGYGEPNVDYSRSFDGAILANGVRVTREDGWLDVELPDGDDDPIEITVSVQLELERDAHGYAFLHARKAMTGDELFEDLRALFHADRTEWVRCLPRAVHEEIERRLLSGRASTAARQAVRPPVVSQSELWNLVTVPHPDLEQLNKNSR